MPRKITSVESPLQGQAWPLTLEQDLATFLDMLEERFRKDSSNPLPAFEALIYVARMFGRQKNHRTTRS